VVDRGQAASIAIHVVVCNALVVGFSEDPAEGHEAPRRYGTEQDEHKPSWRRPNQKDERQKEGARRKPRK
jgi:hypothetical protein